MSSGESEASVTDPGWVLEVLRRYERPLLRYAAAVGGEQHARDVVQDTFRIEELVNYFDYSYPEPANDRPFSVQTDVTAAPWAPEHRLLRIAVKGRGTRSKPASGARTSSFWSTFRDR